MSRGQTGFAVCSLLFLKKIFKKWKQKHLKVRFIYRGENFTFGKLNIFLKI